VAHESRRAARTTVSTTVFEQVARLDALDRVLALEEVLQNRGAIRVAHVRVLKAERERRRHHERVADLDLLRLRRHVAREVHEHAEEILRALILHVTDERVRVRQRRDRARQAEQTVERTTTDTLREEQTLVDEPLDPTTTRERLARVERTASELRVT